MDMFQRVLLVDAASGFYKTKKYGFERYFGPVDLGIHLTAEYRSLNFGVGIFAGSVFPGSNRMVVTGYSPCWQGYYISSMGGAGLVFDNLGINMLSLVGKAPVPSVLYLNRNHGEEIEVEVVPVDVEAIWQSGRKGAYALTDHVYAMFGDRYEKDPRILATGPAALHTDMGAILSVPISKGKISHVDTWAGRGGFGSALVRERGIVAVIYGGTLVDEDFRDRKVVDEWFENKYKLRLMQKDMEVTTKYRFDEKFDTGGTFGVNYAGMGGKIMAFNYRTIFWSDEQRRDLHQRFILDHYLKQFNEETIQKKQQATCGEPCVAVCKKMNGVYKKDYEPYQTLGPLCGIFDQRAAEKLNRLGDAMGFDAISLGGVLAWLMDLLDEGLLTPAELGVTKLPRWDMADFDVVEDSLHNADLACALIEAILARRGLLDFREGVRKWSRIQSRARGTVLHERLLHVGFNRRGWMVPNQYWVSGVLAPMAIAGKYYMIYSDDFIAPRTLGRMCAERMKKELILDNLGMCRFHRGWAEEMLPEVMGSLYDCKEQFERSIEVLAGRIHSRNSPIFWESQRNIDFLHTFLKRKHEGGEVSDPRLGEWLARFDADQGEAAREFWYQTLMGIDESLREFF
ncbi:glyceraldehyde-3-phosphate ferredoxin oxidoreductase [Geoalkalibacter ferrihydriticus]|uniref:Aldehyde:ferredoxin oxidoreductase n=2 Tax=Geoalkalibacter ferrihydriticus TaxID=392333 RepID=A0A0C2EGH5_9BACT|nr:aldehyde ferredoxin oxidoreductase C-terminal domain-containing protein [Geoalkalibacter ferrihydriticus]KIH77728.1 aldehyde:ferredoxin oxidoreductase [Geoalkalibacter ferrihydriticus DSM 17813]SDL76084.1 glyceraldehyde-3-phosphate ferredoxin oxidoreductase [Geoalkalibacter ferrihydriticus]